MFEEILGFRGMWNKSKICEHKKLIIVFEETYFFYNGHYRTQNVKVNWEFSQLQWILGSHGRWKSPTLTHRHILYHIMIYPTLYDYQLGYDCPLNNVLSSATNQ